MQEGIVKMQKDVGAEKPLEIQSYVETPKKTQYRTERLENMQFLHPTMQKPKQDFETSIKLDKHPM